MLLGIPVSVPAKISGMPIPGPISFVVDRSSAYYLLAIPASNNQNLLSFDWNVTASSVSNGTGSIVFEHGNSVWSNLVSFNLSAGQASGRQTIDSSWAVPGANNLRVSYWTSNTQFLSQILTLTVYSEYAATVVLIFSPFLAITIVTSAYYLRKRNRRLAKRTT